jgi:hypothetical protein
MMQCSGALHAVKWLSDSSFFAVEWGFFIAPQLRSVQVSVPAFDVPVCAHYLQLQEKKNYFLLIG